MTYAFSKICTAAAALLMTVVGTVYGSFDTPTSCYGEDNTFASEFACSGHWSVSGELLYWKACQTGLSSSPFTVHDTYENDRPVSTCTESSDDMRFKWNTGFRLGLGYDFSYDCCDWNTAVYWAHFHDRAHGQRQECNDAHWKLHYDNLDVIFGRTLGVGCGFNWHPYCGVRATWFTEKLKHHLVHRIVSPENDANRIMAHHQRHEKFKGFGPQIGVDSEWHLGCGFGIYGSLATAVLYGRYHSHHKSYEDMEEGINICESKHRRCSRPAAFDAALGLTWQRYFCDDSLQVALQLGWEHHRLFDYNQICQNGDLCLDGLTFSAAVAF